MPKKLLKFSQLCTCLQCEERGEQQIEVTVASDIESCCLLGCSALQGSRRTTSEPTAHHQDAYYRVPSELSTSLPALLAPKPELSLPVSRLCEPEPPRTVVTTSQRLDSADDAETASGEVCYSDNNNNHPEVLQRQTVPLSSEMHVCDQCSKSFVTRASLKVGILVAFPQIRTRIFRKPE